VASNSTSTPRPPTTLSRCASVPGERGDLARVGADAHRPRGKGQDKSNDDNRRVRGIARFPPRAHGLLRVRAGGLEAHEGQRPDREEQAERGPVDGGRVRGQDRAGGEPLAGRGDDAGRPEADRHRDLGQHEQRQQAAEDLDADRAEERDEQPAAGRDHPPLRLDAEQAVQQRRGRDPDDAVDAELQRVVGGEREPGGGDAGGPAEAAGHICVKGAREGRPVDHCRVTRRENQQDDRDGDKRQGYQRPAATGIGGGHDGDHYGEGRGRGDREERHRSHANTAGSEGGGRILACIHGSIEPYGVGI
jgi:hypothetical protein